LRSDKHEGSNEIFKARIFIEYLAFKHYDKMSLCHMVKLLVAFVCNMAPSTLGVGACLALSEVLISRHSRYIAFLLGQDRVFLPLAYGF
jgi:hypothetical protein